MLQRKTLLRYFGVTIGLDGKKAEAEVNMECGIWDTEADGGNGAWANLPERKKETFANLTAADKKRLNDVVGLAVTKLAEENERLRAAATADTLAISSIKEQVAKLETALKDADGAANNALQLEKVTRAQLFAMGAARLQWKECATARETKLAKIRRLTFGLLGK